MRRRSCESCPPLFSLSATEMLDASLTSAAVEASPTAPAVDDATDAREGERESFIFLSLTRASLSLSSTLFLAKEEDPETQADADSERERERVLMSLSLQSAYASCFVASPSLAAPSTLSLPLFPLLTHSLLPSLASRTQAV